MAALLSDGSGTLLVPATTEEPAALPALFSPETAVKTAASLVTQGVPPAEVTEASSVAGVSVVGLEEGLAQGVSACLASTLRGLPSPVTATPSVERSIAVGAKELEQGVSAVADSDSLTQEPGVPVVTASFVEGANVVGFREFRQGVSTVVDFLTREPGVSAAASSVEGIPAFGAKEVSNSNSKSLADGASQQGERLAAGAAAAQRTHPRIPKTVLPIVPREGAESRSSERAVVPAVPTESLSDDAIEGAEQSRLFAAAVEERTEGLADCASKGGGAAGNEREPWPERQGNGKGGAASEKRRCADAFDAGRGFDDAVYIVQWEEFHPVEAHRGLLSRALGGESGRCSRDGGVDAGVGDAVGIAGTCDGGGGASGGASGGAGDCGGLSCDPTSSGAAHATSGVATNARAASAVAADAAVLPSRTHRGDSAEGRNASASGSLGHSAGGGTSCPLLDTPETRSEAPVCGHATPWSTGKFREPRVGDDGNEASNGCDLHSARDGEHPVIRTDDNGGRHCCAYCWELIERRNAATATGKFPSDFSLVRVVRLPRRRAAGSRSRSRSEARTSANSLEAKKSGVSEEERNGLFQEEQNCCSEEDRNGAPEQQQKGSPEQEQNVFAEDQTTGSAKATCGGGGACAGCEERIEGNVRDTLGPCEAGGGHLRSFLRSLRQSRWVKGVYQDKASGNRVLYPQ